EGEILRRGVGKCLVLPGLRGPGSEQSSEMPGPAWSGSNFQKYLVLPGPGSKWLCFSGLPRLVRLGLGSAVDQPETMVGRHSFLTPIPCSAVHQSRDSRMQIASKPSLVTPLLVLLLAPALVGEPKLIHRHLVS